MLVILEKNVRDSRAIWQALWQGFRIRRFAADDLIRQARRYKAAAADASAAPGGRADWSCAPRRPISGWCWTAGYELASEPKASAPAWASAQLSFES